MNRLDLITIILISLSAVMLVLSFLVEMFVDQGAGVLLAAASCYVLLLAVFSMDYAGRKRG